MLFHKLQPTTRVLPRLAGPLMGAARRALRIALKTAGDGHLQVALPSGEVWHLGGGNPDQRAYATIRDERVFARVLFRGELGAAEAYVAGHWDSPDLVAVLRWFARNLSDLHFENGLTYLGCLPDLIRHRVRSSWRHASERNIHAHYDLSNDFYQLFLDPAMVYSCAEFAPDSAFDCDKDLEDAQTRKLERVCQSLNLAESDHLLEIGCGWGAFAMHAARTRGCRVTAVTLSRKQLELARQRVARAGLDHRVEIRYADYRELRGHYDAIASIEMLEAVGYRGLPLFFARCGKLLVDQGRALIQTITMPDERFPAYRRGVDWIQTAIFPGALIPSRGAIYNALADTRLRVVGYREIGPHYAPTLHAWRQRFHRSLDRAHALGVDLPFERSWDLYLAFSEAAFAERSLGVGQLLLTRD